MKACEEWLKKEAPVILYGSHCGDLTDAEAGAVRAGWRAVLEWVQRTVKELDEQDAPICMGDVIRQELEN